MDESVEQREAAHALLESYFILDRDESEFTYVDVLNQLRYLYQDQDGELDIVTQVNNANDLEQLQTHMESAFIRIRAWWISLDSSRRYKALVKILLTMPSLEITSLSEFRDLFDTPETSSQGTKTIVGGMILKPDMLAKTSFTKIDDEFFKENIQLLMQEINSFIEKFQPDEGQNVLRTLVEDVPFYNIMHGAHRTYFNKLSEETTRFWFFEKFGSPICAIYNHIFNNGGVHISVEKHGALKMTLDHRQAKSEAYDMYSDFALIKCENKSFLSGAPLCFVELKRFNIQGIIKDLSQREFQPFYNQIVAEMLSMNTSTGILSDGYNFLVMILNWESKEFDEYLSNPNDAKLPILFRRMNISSTDLTPRAAIMALLYSESKSNSEQLNLKMSKFEKLRDCMVQSPSDFSCSLKNWAYNNYIESRSFESVVLDKELLGNGLSIYRTTTDLEPQVIKLTKKLIRSEFGFEIPGDEAQQVMLTIFDPVRYVINNFKSSEIIERNNTFEMFEQFWKTQLQAYKTITRFNDLNSGQINTPKLYKCGTMNLEITNTTYLTGHYMICDNIEQKPTNIGDLIAGKQQLEMLKEAGIHPEDVSVNDMYCEDGKFYIINLWNAIFGSNGGIYDLNMHNFDKLMSDGYDDDESVYNQMI